MNPQEPQSYPRRVLLAVTGLSPQVVTETIYALAVKPMAERAAFVPTEVHIVTTAQGAENARLNLLSDQIGWFSRLCRDYRLPGIVFPVDNIHILPGASARPLEDIRTKADNERCADFITDLVRRFTADSAAALHVSIAGGRKTMGYYIGYALSLYGRVQDRLSHVLVSEPYENNKDFYYPTPYEHAVHVKREGKDVAYDCRNATVDLAEIPFVRLREELPRELIDGRTTFSEAVAEAQRALPPLALVIDPATHTLIAGGESVKLGVAEFVFYWMLAERRRQGQPGAHWSEKAIGAELLTYYRRILKPASGELERAEQTCRKFTKDNFDPRKSHINDDLKRALGKRRARPYLIAVQDRIAGSRYRRSGLALPPDAIKVTSSKPGAKAVATGTASLPTQRARRNASTMSAWRKTQQA